MKVPNFRRFDPGDYPSLKGPDWERFLEHLNAAMEGVTLPLQGRLGFGDNFNCELKTFKVAEDTDYTVELKRLKGRVIDVQLLGPDLYDYPSIAWEHLSQSSVKVRITFDTAPTTDKEVTLLFLGE